MGNDHFKWMDLLEISFIFSQVLYFFAFLVEIYFVTRPRNFVELPDDENAQPSFYPYIVLFYPVLDELEETMRTTMFAVSKLNYPKDRFEVIAIPNASDLLTVASLRRLQNEFGFLQIMEVPPTSDPSWNVVWANWDRNEHAYWWHRGETAGVRDLPPKKTRQLIYSFYNILKKRNGDTGFYVNYLDADSAPMPNHFRDAAFGCTQYDVLQATNISGNPFDSMAATFHSFDHMAWDGSKYAHFTANGHHPYYVLGKGQFFRASDLEELGGLHPWLTIEDPEVGLRLWKNGRQIGVIREPLIEEVPVTFAEGIKQRERWMAGFWQTQMHCLKEMNFTAWERFKARLNLVPPYSLAINSFGIPLGLWALYEYLQGGSNLPHWTWYLAGFNTIGFVAVVTSIYRSAWRRLGLYVMPSKFDRLIYLLRVNPICIWFYWTLWTIPLWKGWRMYRNGSGLMWERTEKINANEEIIRTGPIAGGASKQSPAAPIPGRGV